MAVGRVRVALAVLSLVIASCQAAPTDDTVAAETSATSVPVTTTTSVAGDVVVVSGSRMAGFTDVEEALAEARHRWASAGLAGYGYFLEVDCDCPDEGSGWVRLFPERDNDEIAAGLPTMPGLFNAIEELVADRPERVSAAFSEVDGHVGWYEVGGDDARRVSVEEFHQIGAAPPEFNGEWRFASGVLDGERFVRGVAALGVSIASRQGATGLSYSTDCNETGGFVDIHNGWFGASLLWTTLVGCESTPEVEAFEEAFSRIDAVRLEDDQLTMTGPEAELRFVRFERVTVTGEPILTAAGQHVTLDVADRQGSGVYLIAWGFDRRAWEVTHLLRSSSAGEPTWEPWREEPQHGALAVQTGGGTIVVPSDLSDGDHYVCSPYWEPEPVCFVLQVRPPSAPWIVTAGPAGVVLLDANGTSEQLWTEPAAVAFHLDGDIVIEPADPNGSLTVVAGDGSVDEVPVGGGDRLLEAMIVAGRRLVVISGAAGTAVVDIDDGSRTDVGPPATGAANVGGMLALRLGPERLMMVTLAGQVMWERTIDAAAMALGSGDVLRMDTLQTMQTEAGPPYFQYVVTEFVEFPTGETFDEIEREVAIPDEGHNISEPCIRPDMTEPGILLCTQPDGRVVTLEVNDGDSRTVATAAASATFVRPMR